MANGIKVYPPLEKQIIDKREERFSEGDRVIVDKGTIHEQHGNISFFFGKGYCEVETDYGYDLPVNIGRLSKQFIRNCDPPKAEKQPKL
jgi:hypothetical protein